MIIKLAGFILITLLLQGCGGGDHLYCSRYQYLYNQLLESDAPPELVIRAAIAEEMSKPAANKGELVFMEQVLNDFVKKLKPADQSPRDFCLKNKRYKHQ